MWVVVAIIAVVVGLMVFLLWRTATWNNDPVQKEIAALIIEMMENGATESAQSIFYVSSQRALMMAMIDPKDHQSRYSHALSMVKPMISDYDYRVAHVLVRAMAK